MVPDDFKFFIVPNPRSDVFAAMELLHGVVINQSDLTEVQTAAYELLLPFIEPQASELADSALTPPGWNQATFEEVTDCKPDKIFLLTFLL